MPNSTNHYLNRRSLMALAPAGLTLAALGLVGRGSPPAFAQSTPEASDIDGNARGDIPTYGTMRPGPVGINPPRTARKGVAPIAMKIEKAQVDSQIETAAIEDGVMLDPSGPYVVAWYEDTGKLGEETNTIFAGHLDYYDVGEAVFFHLGELAEGDPIEVTGEDDIVFTYTVEWARNYTMEELDSTTIQEIVGKTKTEYITLITCGGEFDFDAGVYKERFVVRARRSGS